MKEMENNAMEFIKVLNIDVLNITRQELLENLKEGILVTPNLDHLIKLQKDKEFYDMYHKNDADSKIFLLSAKEGIAVKAMERINEKVGYQMVVGAHSPSFGFEKHEDECEKLVRIVNESGANVLLVGVGAPKQEKWIMKYRDKMPGVKVFMALGATIDFEAGASNGLLRFSKNLHWNGFIVSAWNLSVSSSVTS